MKRILASFLALSICLSLLSVPAVAQQTYFRRNPLFLRMEHHNRELLAQTTNTQKTEADRLLQQADQQYQNSQFRSAIQSLQQALTIYRKIGARQGETKALLNLGATFYFLGDYSKAIDYAHQVLAISKAIPDSLIESAALVNLGQAYYALGNYTKAIEYQQKALVIARASSNRLGEGKALGNLGFTYKELGDYNKAIDYHQQSLVIFRELKDRLSERIALDGLGNAYGFLGNNSKAIDYHRQSLTIAREIQDQLGEAEALSSLGVDYRILGNYRQSIEYHQQSLAIMQKIGARRGVRAALDQVGRAYDALGNSGKAIDYYQQSLAIAREIQDRPGEVEVLIFLGNAYFSLGDYYTAIKYYHQSLNIARAIQNRRGEGNALGGLGNAYLVLGNYRKAIDYQQQSLNIARATQERIEEGGSLGNLGSAYFALGDYDKAIEYYQQSLTIAREIHDRWGEGMGLNNLGAALFRSGKLMEAERTLFKSIEIWESIRTRIGSHDAEGDAYKVSIFQEQDRTYRTLQKVLIAQNKSNTALEIAERGRARALVDLLTTLFFPKSASQSTLPSPTIQRIQHIAKEQNVTLVEYSIIVEDLKNTGSLLGRQSELFIWVIQPTGEVTFRSVNLKPLWQQQETSEPKTSSRNPWRSHLASWGYPVIIVILIVVIGICIGLAVWRGRLAKISPTSHRQLTLRLLLFLVAACSIVGLAWLASHILLSRDLATRSEQQPKTALAELIFSTHESGEQGIRGLAEIASGKTRQSPKERLQQLHQLLIQPIADLLPTDPNSRVIFIPQGDLFFVPFPALQDANGKHLIEKHTILTAPSIQVLELTHQRRQELAARQNKLLESQNALVVGNPIMPKVASVPGEPPEQLKPLPGAEQEAKEIAKRLNTQAIIGKQATKAAIVQQMPKARLIHLATHGLLDDLYNGDIPGAIALAPSGKDDGLLRAREILKLKLNAELIVLSACNTGQGRITGDGVIGLSRSLFTAGVPSVIVSLWAVPDAPTAFLMTNFYKNLQKQPDKAQALRQAMLTTMKKYPDPENWAAFTLIGEAK